MAKDRKIDMVILGLLSHENLTGYDIKKQIDNGIRFFWKGSFGSIYPSLSAMETEGLVEKVASPDNHSGRERIHYGITESGKLALSQWLSNSKADNDLKYETLLKLFFGGAVDTSVSLATIEQFEADITRDLAVLKMYKENLSRVLNDKSHVFYYLTVSFGVESYEGYLRWCKESKELLSKME